MLPVNLVEASGGVNSYIKKLPMYLDDFLELLMIWNEWMKLLKRYNQFS